MREKAPRRSFKIDVPAANQPLERTNLITPAGFQKLREERDQLARKERPRVLDEVRQAVLQGDRSENAEYQYGKKRLREIDRRVRFLNRRMEIARIIDPREQNPDCVRFGATVIIEDDRGLRRKYMIVGEDEIDLSSGKISWKSPVGAGLLKAQKGDEVEIDTPRGLMCFTIIDYTYGE